ncbi:MAG: tetratricopeptide repeat protein [Wenzhouxiangella sp.]|jgi:predicted negative regulator of RcsB-dependent stress response|nr:tetratricopeptide repeat protein [Wenzhouxiangella sp.]
MAVELYDEHEQGERVRKWIKEYTPAIIVGLILAFGGIFGFRYWQDYRADQQLMGSDYYQVVSQRVTEGNLESAESEYQTMLETVGETAYTGLAGMQLAAAWVDDGRLSPAADIYRGILENRRLESLWPVAKLRLARVLEAQGEYQQALSLLEGAAPEGFEASWAETRGDLLFERGRVDEARAAWEDALARRTADGGNPRLLQIKIDAATTEGGTS